MLNIFKKIFLALGIDKSIYYTSMARIIQAVGGIVSVLFVAKYLTGVEQGFYYTFGSIVAIQIFFELGLNGIITQYVAHEMAHLEWQNCTTLKGESKYLSRLSSLLHFSVNWYFFFAGILLLSLLLIGTLFFNKYNTSNELIDWNVPWMLLAVGTSFNLVISPILAFLEGLGKVKEIAKIRLYQQIIGLSFVWGGLILGAKLYILGINCLIGILIIIIFLSGKNNRILLHNIWKKTILEKVDYKKEIFPYQWKIALSWISGYFIFQLFNPVLFATEGAVVAGQMGMTLAALNGIQSLSLSWMTTKVPLYSTYIALNNYDQLDILFNRTLKQSVFINGFTLILLMAIIYVIRVYNIEINGIYLADRFLAYLPMTLMMIALFLNQYISSWAIYLRCHKREPFLVNSIVGGILCCLSTILMAKNFGVVGVTGGYCLITICMFFWSYLIYKNKKNEWHSSY